MTESTTIFTRTHPPCRLAKNTQALRINPEYAQAWYNLGFTYLLTGNRTRALAAVRELRRLDPEQADRLFNMIVPR